MQTKFFGHLIKKKENGLDINNNFFHNQFVFSLTDNFKQPKDYRFNKANFYLTG